jgi:hypothetical protein
MKRSFLAQTLIVFLTVQALTAAESAVKTTWSGFQEQVIRLKLNKRAAWISVSGGTKFKATFLRAEDGGMVVKTNQETKRWATQDGEAMISRDSVQTVRFTGKIGRRGLIGGLAGLGAGAGVAGAAAANGGGGNCEGGACGAALLVIPMLAGLGYLVGHALDKPAPSFIIEH